MFCSEDGVWLKRMEDVTEIVRKRQLITSIEDCPKCFQEKEKKMKFPRGDYGEAWEET